MNFSQISASDSVFLSKPLPAMILALARSLPAVCCRVSLLTKSGCDCALFRKLVGHAHLNQQGIGRVPMAKRLLRRLNAHTVILVTKRLIWDEAKRAANFAKHRRTQGLL